MKQSTHSVIGNCLRAGYCKQMEGLLCCFTPQVRGCVFRVYAFGYTGLVGSY